MAALSKIMIDVPLVKVGNKWGTPIYQVSWSCILCEQLAELTKATRDGLKNPSLNDTGDMKSRISPTYSIWLVAPFALSECRRSWVRMLRYAQVTSI